MYQRPWQGCCRDAPGLCAVHPAALFTGRRRRIPRVKKKILLKLNRKRISSQRHERKQEPGLYKKCISCEARRKSSEACVTRWLGSGWQRERAATPPGFWGTSSPDRSHPGAVSGKTKPYKAPHHHGKEEAWPQENPRADDGQLGCPTPLPHPPKGTAPADISPN